MGRISRISSISAIAGALALGQFVACQPDDDSTSSEREALLAACHLNDGTVGRDDDLRACEPDNKKKTTICHIPPGNPANAHTLCIGNPAVSPHRHHHGDYVGPCKDEVPCPPPGGMGGSPGVDAGAGGNAGNSDGGPVGTGGMGQAGGQGGSAAGGTGGSPPPMM